MNMFMMIVIMMITFINRAGSSASWRRGTARIELS
jgi:hypothetical protein